MSVYKVTYTDGTDAQVKVRMSDQLAWERRSRTEPGGPLEMVLFMLHRASGSPATLDTWVETVDDWDTVDAEATAADPTDPPLSDSPD